MKYIDLGLKSGTLWADENEEGFYTFYDAVSKYGDRLPTYEQFEELQNQCRWEWNDKEYRVTGPNGNSIDMPAAGYRDGDRNADYVGSLGNYWSSTPDDLDDSWYLYFSSGGVGMGGDYQCIGRSVRLVK